MHKEKSTECHGNLPPGASNSLLAQVGMEWEAYWSYRTLDLGFEG